MIKLVIGLGIIIASFIYILVNHDKSMMDNLMDKQNKRLEKMEQEEAEQAAQQKNDT